MHGRSQAHLRLARRVLRAVEKASTADTPRKGQLARADTEKQALSANAKPEEDKQRLIEVIRPFTPSGYGEETPYATVWDVSLKRLV